MRRLLHLFAFAALFLSTSMGSIAHAAEAIDCANLPAMLHWAHSDSDDPPASDPGSDKAVTHHHADCHGHHIAVSIPRAHLQAPHPLHVRYPPQAMPAIAAADRIARLRPPIA